jgi:hypothetical protein
VAFPLRSAAALFAPALWLLPRVALACPVCTGGQEEAVGRAFFIGSLVLSGLPLVAVGAIAWWLRRRARALAAAAAEAAPAADRVAPAPAGVSRS